MDEVTIGARLRALRRWRGMTQAELSGLAGLSPSFLSMVEHGQRLLDRRSHIAALATALRVSETDLVGGPHLSADAEQADPYAVIPAVRRALHTNTLDEPACDRARPLAEPVRQMGRIEPLHQACDYVKLGRDLPAVVEELHHHVAAPMAAARETVAYLLGRASAAAGGAEAARHGGAYGCSTLTRGRRQ